MAQGIPINATLAHGLTCFSIDDEKFAVPVRVVREINAHLDMTVIHRARSYVRGLVNLRGQIVTVLDLGERLERGRREIGPTSRLVVFKTNAELDFQAQQGLRTSQDKMGILVDCIHDVVIPEAHDLEGPPANLPPHMIRFVAGVCKTDRSTLTVLNSCELLDHSGDVERAGAGRPATPVVGMDVGDSL